MNSIRSLSKRLLRAFGGMKQGLRSISCRISSIGLTESRLAQSRSLLLASVAIVLSVATLGWVGTVVAECEPGQPQTYCGPVEDPHNAGGDEPSLPAKGVTEGIELWADAQQSPPEIDQGAMGTQTAESVSELIEPGRGTAAQELRLEIEAEADRVTAEALDSAADAFGDALHTVGDALGLHTPIPSIDDPGVSDNVRVVIVSSGDAEEDPQAGPPDYVAPDSEQGGGETSRGDACVGEICLTR